MQADAIVHVIDDDEEVRRSLGFLLASAGMEATLHDSATAFLDALPGVGRGCVVTDVQMPAMTGVDLVRHLRREGIGLPVIVMTGHGNVALAVEAMKSGAHDFLEKPFDDEQLLASVRRAVGEWERDERREAERRDYRNRMATLSGRERDVFDSLVEGHPNKITAHLLGISPRTVEVYRANVMSKMKASSLSELVRMALFVRLPDEEPEE